MARIATLTLNPAIDCATETEDVRPIHKMRTVGDRFDPGGGGINVARVIRELGGSAFAVYLTGGMTAPLLDGLLRHAGVEGRGIPAAGDTRISYTVHERSTGREFRFVPQGPVVAAAEWQACLAAVEEVACDYLVASGSLPRGVPADLYAQVAEVAARRQVKLVLDTSGEALRLAVGRGLHLIKPSLGELEGLVGRELRAPAQQDAALRALLEEGAAEMIALTLGRDGAVLATRRGLMRLPGLQVAEGSAVGAGDSFVAAMVLGLAEGRDAADAFTLGAAAGTAAVITMGTELCRRADVERLYAEFKALAPAAPTP